MAVSKYETKKGIRWKATVYLGTDARTGKEKRAQKKGFKTKKEAQQWESTVRLDGGHVDSNITFEQVYDIWLESYKYQVKESTLLTTKQHINIYILPTFGHLKIAKIKPYQVQAVINDWAVRYRSCKKFTGHLACIFKYALKQGFIRENPFDKVEKVKTQVKPKERKKVWTKEELNTFLEACKLDDLPYTYPLFRLLAYTGIRRGEILALTWNDFDEVNGTISVTKTLTKTEKGIEITTPKTKASIRKISLDKETLKVMKKWRREQAQLMLKLGYNTKKDGQYIFTNRMNNHFYISRLSDVIKKICGNCADLEPITPHGFRHTHCSILISSGVGIKEVQKRLGHGDVQTTLNIYAHAMNNDSDTAEAFARALGE